MLSLLSQVPAPKNAIAAAAEGQGLAARADGQSLTARTVGEMPGAFAQALQRSNTDLQRPAVADRRSDTPPRGGTPAADPAAGSGAGTHPARNEHRADAAGRDESRGDPAAPTAGDDAPDAASPRGRAALRRGGPDARHMLAAQRARHDAARPETHDSGTDTARLGGGDPLATAVDEDISLAAGLGNLPAPPLPAAMALPAETAVAAAMTADGLPALGAGSTRSAGALALAADASRLAGSVPPSAVQTAADPAGLPAASAPTSPLAPATPSVAAGVHMPPAPAGDATGPAGLSPRAATPMANPGDFRSAADSVGHHGATAEAAAPATAARPAAPVAAAASDAAAVTDAIATSAPSAAAAAPTLPAGPVSAPEGAVPPAPSISAPAAPASREPLAPAAVANNVVAAATATGTAATTPANAAAAAGRIEITTLRGEARPNRSTSAAGPRAAADDSGTARRDADAQALAWATQPRGAADADANRSDAQRDTSAAHALANSGATGGQGTSTGARFAEQLQAMLPSGTATTVAQPMAGAAPAAVPTAHLPTSLYSPDFSPALGAQVTLFARGGVQQARIELNPAEMGPISVQIVIDGSGARVDFHAEVAATRQVIESSLPALASSLRDAGMTLTGGGVFQQDPAPATSNGALPDPTQPGHANGQNGSQDGGHRQGAGQHGIGRGKHPGDGDDSGLPQLSTVLRPGPQRGLVDLVA